MEAPDGGTARERHAHVRQLDRRATRMGATTMNLMLATLTAKDRFETYASEAAIEHAIAGDDKPRRGRIGLRQRVTSVAGHLHVAGRSAAA